MATVGPGGFEATGRIRIEGDAVSKSVDRVFKPILDGFKRLEDQISKGIKVSIDNTALDETLKKLDAIRVAKEAVGTAAGAVAAAGPAAVAGPAVAAPVIPVSPAAAAATGAMAGNMEALGSAASDMAARAASAGMSIEELTQRFQAAQITKDRLIVNIGELNASLGRMGIKSSEAGRILNQEFNRSLGVAADVGAPRFVGALESVNKVFDTIFVESMKASAAIGESVGSAIPRAFEQATKGAEAHRAEQKLFAEDVAKSMGKSIEWAEAYVRSLEKLGPAQAAVNATLSTVNPMRSAQEAFNREMAISGNITKSVQAGVEKFNSTAARTTQTVRQVASALGLSSRATKELEQQALRAGVRFEDFMRKMMRTTAVSREMRDSFDKTNSVLGRVGAVFAGLFVISRITDWAKGFISSLVGITKEAAAFEAAQRKLLVLSDNLGIAHTETGRAVQSLTKGFLTERTAVEGLSLLLKAGLPLSQATKQMREFEESVLSTSGAMQVNENVIKSAQALFDRKSRTLGKVSGLQTNFGQALRMSTAPLDELNEALGTNIRANTLAGESTRLSLALGKEFSTVMGIMAAVTNTTTGQLALLDRNITNIKLALGGELLPIMGAFLRIINKTIPDIAQWIRSNGELIRAVTLTTVVIAALTAALGTLAIAVISIAFAFNIAAWSGWAVVILGVVGALGMLLPAIVGPDRALRTMIRTIGAAVGFIYGLAKAIMTSWKISVLFTASLATMAIILNRAAIAQGAIAAAKAIAALVTAMRGWITAQAILQALGGPAGIAMLALGLVAAGSAVFILNKAFKEAGKGADLFEAKLDEALVAMNEFSGGMGDGSSLLTEFGSKASKATSQATARLRELASEAEKARQTTVALFNALINYTEQLRGQTISSFFDSGSMNRQLEEFDEKFNRLGRDIETQIDKARHAYKRLGDELPDALQKAETALKESEAAARSTGKAVKESANQIHQATRAIPISAHGVAEEQTRRAEAARKEANAALLSAHAKTSAFLPAHGRGYDQIKTGIERAAKASPPKVPVEIDANKEQIEQSIADIKEAIKKGKAGLAEVQIMDPKGLDAALAALQRLKDILRDDIRKQVASRAFDEMLQKMEDYKTFSLDAEKIVGEAQARRIARTMQAQLDSIDLAVNLGVIAEEKAARLRIAINREASVQIVAAYSDSFRFLQKQLEMLADSMVNELVTATDFIQQHRERVERTAQIEAARIRQLEMEIQIRDANATEIEKSAMRLSVERATQAEILRINQSTNNALLNMFQALYNNLRREFFDRIVHNLLDDVMVAISKGFGGAGKFLADAKVEVTLAKGVQEKLDKIGDLASKLTNLESTETDLIKALNDLTVALTGTPTAEELVKASGGPEETNRLRPLFGPVDDQIAEAVDNTRSALERFGSTLYDMTPRLQGVTVALAGLYGVLGEDMPEALKTTLKVIGGVTAVLTILRALGILKAGIDTKLNVVSIATTTNLGLLAKAALIAASSLNKVSSSSMAGSISYGGFTYGGTTGSPPGWRSFNSYRQTGAYAQSETAARYGAGLEMSNRQSLVINVPVSVDGNRIAKYLAEEIKEAAHGAAVKVIKRHALGVGGSV